MIVVFFLYNNYSQKYILFLSLFPLSAWTIIINEDDLYERFTLKLQFIIRSDTFEITTIDELI